MFKGGALLLEKSYFERLRAFIHKKPLGERIKQNRVRLTFLWLLLVIVYCVLVVNMDDRSEAMQAAGRQAQAIAGGLLESAGGVQTAKVDDLMFLNRKCSVRAVVPFDRSTTDAGKVLGFYDEKLKADGWSLARHPRSAEGAADSKGVLYQRGDRESVTVDLGADKSSVLFVVVVNAFSYEFFLNIFFHAYFFFGFVLTIAVLFGWDLLFSWI